jgi:hypothetical protein
MERIQALIAKLKEQADQQADAGQMLATLQLLRNELSGQQSSATAPNSSPQTWQAPRTLGTSKVSVMLPASMRTEPQYEKYAPKATNPPVMHEKETVLVEKGTLSIVQENGQLDMVFDPMMEIPTLSHQLKDNNSRNTNGEPESLNDKLRQGKTELIEMLKETPVRDLRKAIGINDRFLFINDLFRGDESMYERSVKTINSFSIFPEAEYWINRELKVKLGWKADDPAVIHFDQLIKRRFS